MREKILSIKKEMENQGISHNRIAVMIGEDQTKISRLLSGKTKKPDFEVVEKLRGALGMVSEPATGYGISTTPQALTPGEAEALRIMRECPEALAVVRMMGDVDSDTQKDILRIAEKEKLLQDMIKERIDKKTA